MAPKQHRSQEIIEVQGTVRIGPPEGHQVRVTAVGAPVAYGSEPGLAGVEGTIGPNESRSFTSAVHVSAPTSTRVHAEVGPIEEPEPKAKRKTTRRKKAAK